MPGFGGGGFGISMPSIGAPSIGDFGGLAEKLKGKKISPGGPSAGYMKPGGYTVPEGMVFAGDMVTDPVTGKEMSRSRMYETYGVSDPKDILAKSAEAPGLPEGLKPPGIPEIPTAPELTMERPELGPAAAPYTGYSEFLDKLTGFQKGPLYESLTAPIKERQVEQRGQMMEDLAKLGLTGAGRAGTAMAKLTGMQGRELSDVATKLAQQGYGLQAQRLAGEEQWQRQLPFKEAGITGMYRGAPTMARAGAEADIAQQQYLNKLRGTELGAQLSQQQYRNLLTGMGMQTEATGVSPMTGLPVGMPGEAMLAGMDPSSYMYWQQQQAQLANLLPALGYMKEAGMETAPYQTQVGQLMGQLY